MAEVLLFHHAQGRTKGVVHFAERLRAAGHTVHLPDLYDGQVFDDLEAGVGLAQQIGFDVLIDRGEAVADDLPPGLVYAGISLGVLPAQKLAQTRAGAAGAILIEACVPPEEFGGSWPGGVPVQIHGMAHDEFFAGEGDLEAAEQLSAAVEGAELFVYDGDRHLFADDSLPSFDAAAAALLMERVLTFLASVD